MNRRAEKKNRVSVGVNDECCALTVKLSVILSAGAPKPSGSRPYPLPWNYYRLEALKA